MALSAQARSHCASSAEADQHGAATSHTTTTMSALPSRQRRHFAIATVQQTTLLQLLANAPNEGQIQRIVRRIARDNQTGADTKINEDHDRHREQGSKSREFCRFAL